MSRVSSKACCLMWCLPASKECLFVLSSEVGLVSPPTPTQPSFSCLTWKQVHPLSTHCITPINLLLAYTHIHTWSFDTYTTTTTPPPLPPPQSTWFPTRWFLQKETGNRKTLPSVAASSQEGNAAGQEEVVHFDWDKWSSALRRRLCQCLRKVPECSGGWPGVCVDSLLVRQGVGFSHQELNFTQLSLAGCRSNRARRIWRNRDYRAGRLYDKWSITCYSLSIWGVLQARERRLKEWS